jgi:hypothetical protein
VDHLKRSERRELAVQDSLLSPVLSLLSPTSHGPSSALVLSRAQQLYVANRLCSSGFALDLSLDRSTRIQTLSFHTDRTWANQDHTLFYANEHKLVIGHVALTNLLFCTSYTQ